MFRKILLDTKNRERIFEDSVRDNFGKSIKEDLFHEVEIKVENMQEAYNISKNQGASIEIKLIELKMIL